MWFSPFMVSLCTLVLLIVFFLEDSDTFNAYKKLFFLFGALLVAIGISLLVVKQPGISKELLLLVGWFILSATALMARKVYWRQVFLITTVFVLFVNVYSVSNYLSNKAVYDELLLQSKSLPVLGMHHIHFGIINAFVLLIGFGLYVEKRLHGIPHWLIIGALSIVFVCFHILSSRTGLLGFYATIMIGLVWHSVRRKQYKPLILGSSTIAVTLVLAFFLSTSFKHKIYNSLEDFESLTSGVDKNYKSMTMRVEAYKTSLRIIADYPLFGVGSTGVFNTLQTYYELSNTELKKENRIGPHNQFLEYGIKYGIPGIFWMVCFFWLMFKYAPKDSIYPILVLVLLLLACQLESLFERQNSIFFVSMYIGMSYHLFSRKKAEA